MPNDILATQTQTLKNLVDHSPKVRFAQVPHYPARLARNGIGGKVYVFYSYNTTGDVTSTRLGRTSGYDDMDKAAVKAVKSWKFFPMLIDGKPVAGEGAIPITFLPPKSV